MKPPNSLPPWLVRCRKPWRPRSFYLRPRGRLTLDNYRQLGVEVRNVRHAWGQREVQVHWERYPLFGGWLWVVEYRWGEWPSSTDAYYGWHHPGEWAVRGWHRDREQARLDMEAVVRTMQADAHDVRYALERMEAGRHSGTGPTVA